jgi:micrococcal nuclease
LKRTRKRIIFFYFSFIILALTVGMISSSPALQQQSKMLKYAFASIITAVPENNFGGVVTRVIDGDTLDIKTTNDEGDIITIRLVLVDAPESNEMGYTEAKTFVSENCLDKPAIVDPDNNQDLSYGRFVAVVYCDGVNINEAVIAAGLADIYKSFCAISEFANTDWAQKYGCENNDSGFFSSRSSNNDNGSSKDSKTGEITDNCDSSYSGVCIPSPPPNLDCGDIPHKNFGVLSPDPHRFDGEGDGIGCES